jgi:ATP-dependent Clp protease protease subunit
VKSIIEYNMEDDAYEKDAKNFERKPIVIIINCYGGVVYDGWALIAAIEMSGTPIVGLAIGSVMSMALPIFLSCHTRLAHTRATFMYHEVITGAQGSITEVKEGLENAEVLQDRNDAYILEKTTVLRDKLLSVRERKINWFIPAEEAVKYGIIDEVITEPVAWI